MATIWLILWGKMQNGEEKGLPSPISTIIMTQEKHETQNALSGVSRVYSQLNIIMVIKVSAPDGCGPAERGCNGGGAGHFFTEAPPP